jgi:uncharacterized protein (DUF1810 family)
MHAPRRLGVVLRDLRDTYRAFENQQTLRAERRPTSVGAMSLTRFKVAQDALTNGFATALAELRAGRKQSHWIWYIFPQLTGLGRSETARYYGLPNLDEACAYLRDPLLRSRLQAITEVVAQQLDQGVRLTELMGGETDALKLVSSLTLFEIAAKKSAAEDASLQPLVELCGRVLVQAEQEGFPRCDYTIRQVPGSA